MSLFFKPRKNKTKWASIVFTGAQPGMNIDEQVLDEATDVYIKQHARILYDNIHIVLTSEDPEIRKISYKVANCNYGSLAKVYRFATKEQKAAINLAETDFFKMVDFYKHPNGKAPVISSREKKEAFWEVYGEGEMLDIFSGKKK